MAKKFNVAGIGELLWDVFPSEKTIGGAPFNFAVHAKRAGCHPYIVSAVGNDVLGREIIENALALGISDRYIQRLEYPTGVVRVTLDASNNPTYRIAENVAWDNIQYNESLSDLSEKLDAVCFGSLAQRSQCTRQTIRTFLQNLSPACLKVFDVNIRQHYYDMNNILELLEISNVVKLNEDELGILMKHFEYQGDVEDKIKKLIVEFELDLIAYTLGEKGSWLIGKEMVSGLPAKKVDIVDSVGAGDAFTATLIHGLLQSDPIAEVHKNAVEVAAKVCTIKGAIPDSATDY